MTVLSRANALLPEAVAEPVRRTYHEAMMRSTSALAERRLARRLRRPLTFNDKVRRKMAYDRNPILTTFQDKVAVRDYVASTIGTEFLTECYAVASDPAEIDWTALPREYVAKVNHACKGMVLVSERAGAGRELPTSAPSDWLRYRIHPDNADPDRLVPLFREWLTWEYSSAEWAYHGIEHRVLVEELLTNPDGGPPLDYKFYVFNGRCRTILVDRWVDADWFEIAELDLFTPTWEHLNAQVLVANAAEPPAPPPRLAEMVELAERLAAPVDMVRVDLYAIGDRVAFGELTNYPGGGHHYFDPAAFDYVWGSYWRQDY